MLDVLQGFVHELRLAGLPVSMTENLDAMRAVEYVPLQDRDAFKTALSATLVKHHGPLQGVRDRVRGVLLDLQPRRRAAATSASRRRRGQADFDQLAQRDGRGRRDGPALQRRARADAARRADEDGHGAAARARGRGGRAVRGHGAGPAGRRRVLPVPHAAAARRRRPRRQDDGAGPAGRRRSAKARSTSGSRRRSTRAGSRS